MVVGGTVVTAGGVLESFDEGGGCIIGRSRTGVEVAWKKIEAIGMAARRSLRKPSTGETGGGDAANAVLVVIAVALESKCSISPAASVTESVLRAIGMMEADPPAAKLVATIV